MFHGSILEEKVFAVFLLEKMTTTRAQKSFGSLKDGCRAVSTWGGSDGRVHYLLGPCCFPIQNVLRVFLSGRRIRIAGTVRGAAVSLIAVPGGLF